MSSARWVRDEDGFTLAELVIAISILGVVMVTLTTAIVLGLKTTDQTNQRILQSHDAQIASAYLANDVQNMTSVTGATCGTGTAIIGFQYADGSVASWCYRTVSGQKQIARTRSGVTLVMSHYVASLPNVSCFNNGSSVSCTSGQPDRVRIQVQDSISVGSLLNRGQASTYSFTLTGARRMSTGPSQTTGAGTDTSATFMSLGGGCPLSISGSGTTLVINGSMLINKTSGTGCSSGASDAVFLSNKTSTQLTICATGANCASRADAVSKNSKGLFGIQQGGTCSSCNSTNAWPYPPGSFPQPLPDPYAFLSPPDETALGLGAGNCTTSSGTKSCTPGVYTSQLTTTGSAKNVNLAPGIYVFEKGFAPASGATVNGSGVMLYNGCGVNRPGSLSGSCTASGYGSIAISGNADVTLTPMTTGSYAGVLIFQDRANTSPMTLNGGSSVNAKYAGVVYAPKASSLSLTAGGSGIHVSSLVAQAIVLSGNGSVVVG
jgi:prepilin-type N-terminal cleavage/methylation domain-containing protein